MTDALDIEMLTSIKNMMKDRFPDLIESYLENSALYIEKAEKAFAGGDARTVTDSMHPITSSSASIGVTIVAEIARKIEIKAEDAAKNGSDLSDVEIMLNELKNAFIAVKDRLLQEAESLAT